MALDDLLDQILVPRPNGSEALERVADFLARFLAEQGAAVSNHEFSATPHGFQLVWSAALLLLGGYVAAIARERYRLAFGLVVLTALLLLCEFEWLLSPVSGLWTATERNVIGRFAGSAGGPTLVFAAHYDTTTHFGDHFDWGAWGFRQGPATGLALALSLYGAWRKRGGRSLALGLRVPLALLACVPFAMMFWFQSVGPLLRAPSPGAVDNGGSIAALLRLAERLGERESTGATNVEIVFLAAEEERTLGSWAHARTLDPMQPRLVVNLESIGASDEIAYIPEDGFALRRFRSSNAAIDFVQAVATPLRGAPLPARELPPGTLTDGRSYLAHGIEAITLRSFTGDQFPRRLHSEYDSRDRLSIAAIEAATDLLYELVEHSDANPDWIGRLRKEKR